MDRATQSKNRFQARAELYLSMADAQAQRIADGWDEAPADSRKLTPDEIRTLWNFSPSEQPASDFWALHDQALGEAMQQVDPSDQQQVEAAHNQAEQQALNAVYPNRAKLAGLGTAELGEQVKRAEQIKRLVDGPAGGADVNG